MTTFAKTLRDYQCDSEQAIYRELERVGSTLLVLPTGTGKTVVMAKIATGWDKGNVLLIAHRVELIDQAADKIAQELGYRPLVEQASRTVDPTCLWQGGQVVVGSVQSLHPSRLAKYATCPFGLALIDEAHHATSPSWRAVVERLRMFAPGLKVLGVTATPRRADNTALGIVFDSVAYDMALPDAIDQGWLVPLRQEYVTIENVDFSGVGLATSADGETDLRREDLEAVLIQEEALHALAGPILERSESRQVLVFTAGVAHAHMLAAILNRDRPGSAVAVDGKTDKAERAKVVKRYQEGDLQFLVNFGVFTEGFDAPATSIVAMGRPTKSEGLYCQMAGRGTRPLPGTVDGPLLRTPEIRKSAIAASAKTHVLLMDFVGNSRHKLVSSVDLLGGNYDVEARALAHKRVKAKPGSDVADELNKARAELMLLREQERRKGIKAKVSYTATEVNPFASGESPGAVNCARGARGGCSDAQIGFLVNLGVPHETAAGYSKSQAGAVITSLKAKTCTAKQKAILVKYGQPTEGVNFEHASEIIDAIAKNGWRPLK